MVEHLDQLFKLLREQNPTGLICRSDIEKQTKGFLKRQFLANADSLKKGIAGKMVCGGKVFYPVSEVENFIKTRYVR